MLISEDNCVRCCKVTEVAAIWIVGGVRWECLECGGTTGFDFDDDEVFPEGPTACPTPADQ